MRWYGIQPSELARLSLETKIGLLSNMMAINARERLEFILDVGASFSGKSSRDYLMALIDQAYSSPEDKYLRAVAIESITQMG